MQINQITLSGEIYRQQINNFIVTQQGYPQIRKYLIRQLNAESNDQCLIQEILAILSESLLCGVAQKVMRSVRIIEDLVTYAESVMSAAMDEQNFSKCLYIAATQKRLIIHRHYANWIQVRLHISGLLLFWYQKYGKYGQKHWLLMQYDKLIEQGIVFPDKPFITPTANFDNMIKLIEQTGQTLKNIREFTNDAIEQFTSNQQSCLQKQFVRAIKSKVKVLYDMSTNKVPLKIDEMNICQKLYQQLRNLLKKIEQMNEKSIKNIKLKQQKIQIQQKANQENIKSNNNLQKIEQNNKNKNNSYKLIEQKKQIKSNIDLLDLGFQNQCKISNEMKKEKQFQNKNINKNQNVNENINKKKNLNENFDKNINENKNAAKIQNLQNKQQFQKNNNFNNQIKQDEYKYQSLISYETSQINPSLESPQKLIATSSSKMNSSYQSYSNNSSQFTSQQNIPYMSHQKLPSQEESHSPSNHKLPSNEYFSRMSSLESPAKIKYASEDENEDENENGNENENENESEDDEQMKVQGCVDSMQEVRSNQESLQQEFNDNSCVKEYSHTKQFI